jgi:Protein of unknown function (DUF2905)
MLNWLIRSIGLAVILALLIHFQVKLPFFLSWIGEIPGDAWVKDAARDVDFPVTSAVIISSFISLIMPSKK